MADIEKYKDFEEQEQFEDFEEDEAEQEEEMANELAAEQEIYAAERDLVSLREQGTKFKKPSTIKYSILFVLAVVADIVDIIEFTGVGIVVAFVISLIVWILLTGIAWLTNTKLKEARDYIEKIPETLALIQARIAQASRLSLKAVRMGRKFGVMKKATRAIPRLLVRARRFAGKNPLLRIVILGAVDVIPILDIIPFNVIGVILAYTIERDTLKEAQNISSSLSLSNTSGSSR